MKKTALSRFPFPVLALVLLPLLVSLACGIDFGDTPVPPSPVPPTATPSGPVPTPIPVAEITFRVTVPENTPPGDTIQLSLLDEVTGLALNPVRYNMEPVGGRTHAVTIQVPNGTVLKYRYTRKAALPAEEHTADGRPVRYRLYQVNGAGQVTDLVSRWNDTIFTGPTGRINGQLRDATTNQPIPNIMVVAGGVQVLTAWDGTYLIEGLPPAVHNLVAYALDGRYTLYQQGALVAEGATTPASFSLTPAAMVNVTFRVNVPADTFPGVPLYLAGNLYQLGNTFSNLSGGISVPAYRLPVMQQTAERQYSLTLSLPVGADIRYKYTLGDGFWNAEQTSHGGFVIRQIIVPPYDQLVDDTVVTWRSKNSAPIWFDVTVPQDTPAGETVSIQFNPYGWTQPIPMWKLGERQWVYLLSSPLDLLTHVGYRFCRNLQCGVADDSFTPGPNHYGRAMTTGLLFQNLQDQVNSWKWMSSPGPRIEFQEYVAVQERAFSGGVEFLAAYHPSWRSLMATTHQAIKSIGANLVVHTPTWTFTSQNPPVLELVTGTDAPWLDQFDAASQAKNAGLNVALFPGANFNSDPAQWWLAATRDFSWWNVWFERYTTFALHHAGISERLGVKTLVLGGDWLAPALPGGRLANGAPSGVPEDADFRWREIISKVRKVYSGQILWADTFPTGVDTPVSFLDTMDGIYLLWNVSLTDRKNTPSQDLYTQATEIFDTHLAPFANQYDGKIFLAAGYPSADGGITGCVAAQGGGCLSFRTLSQPGVEHPGVTLDLAEQVDVYKAMLRVVAEHAYIDGFVSRGYYPPAVLDDLSPSVHGKPAEQVLQYWYPKLVPQGQ